MVPNSAPTGILSNPNFQKALQVLQQRAGVKTLAEPEATTIHYGTLNQAYYGQTFTLAVTNK